MSPTELRSVYQAEPFRPFGMHMADGRRIPVAARDKMAFFPDDRSIVVVQPDHRMNIIDLNLIVDVEFDPEVTNPAYGNGKTLGG